MNARRQKILETGFRIFAEKTIGKVTMNDVAKAAGIGVATLYRYYNTKPALVMAISTWGWSGYIQERIEHSTVKESTALQEFDYFLESFLELYRNHKDFLRFNQFFNVYVQSEKIASDDMQQYQAKIHIASDAFKKIFSKAKSDGTLRTDEPPEEVFSAVTHLMLAAVTRYAVGLVYEEGTDPEKELTLLKNMILEHYNKGTFLLL